MSSSESEEANITETYNCETCKEEFEGINAYHIATSYGWFCSDECIKKYAKKNKMTIFQVHYGK